MAPRWFLARGGKKLGPFSEDQIKQFVASGQLLPGDKLMLEDSINPTKVQELLAPSPPPAPAAGASSAMMTQPSENETSEDVILAPVEPAADVYIAGDSQQIEIVLASKFEKQFAVRRFGVFASDAGHDDGPSAMFQTRRDAETWVKKAYGSSALINGAFHIYRVDCFGSYWTGPPDADPKKGGFRRFLPVNLRRLRKWVLRTGNKLRTIRNETQELVDQLEKMSGAAPAPPIPPNRPRAPVP